MSNVEMENIVSDISLFPIEKVMRDQKPKTIKDAEHIIFSNLHPTDSNYCVLLKKERPLRSINLIVLK